MLTEFRGLEGVEIGYGCQGDIHGAFGGFVRGDKRWVGHFLQLHVTVPTSL